MASQWNLSVRLTGQGQNLSRTLRETSRDARRASRDIDTLRQDINRLRAAVGRDIRIGVRLDATNLRRDVQAAINGAGPRQGIRVRIGVDATNLRRDVRVALTGAGPQQGIRVRFDVDAAHLRDDIQAAITAAGRGQGLGIQLNLTDTMQLRRDVADAVRWAAWGHRIDIPIGLRNPDQLRRDVDEAVRQAQLNQVIRVRVDTDTAALRNLGRTLNTGGGGSGGSRGLQNALKALLFLLPAVIPLAGGLGANIAPLAGQFAASGAAATVFGAAIAGQVTNLTEAVEAQKKYEDAVAQHGEASEEAATASDEYQVALSKLPAATRETAAALADLKDDYQDWSDALASDTMPVATKSLQLLDALLPHLTPFVEGAANAFERLVTYAGGRMNTGQFENLMETFSENSTDSLNELVTDIIRFAESVDEFTGGEDVQAFLAFCRENGPLAAETLGNIGSALVHLLAGASGSGEILLTVANALAKVVSAVPAEAISVFLQFYTAMRLASMAAAGLTAVTGSAAATSLATFVRSARFGGVGNAVAGVTQQMSGLQKVAGGLGILGAVAIAIDEIAERAKGAPPDVDKLTTSLKELAATGEFSGELESTFGDIDGFVSKMNRLEGTEKVLDKVLNPRGKAALEPILDGVISKIDPLVNGSDGLEAMKDDFESLDKAFAQLATSGHGDLAAEQFAKFEQAALDAGHSQSEINKLFPEYQKAVAAIDAEQKVAARSMGLFGEAALETQAKLDAQKKSTDGLRASIQALNEVNRAAGSAMNAMEQAIDDAADAATESAGALTMSNGQLDLNSQKARDAESSLSDLAASTDEAVTAAREQGKSWEHVTGIYERGRKAFVDTAMQMGLTKTQAESLADAYLSIPDKASTKVEMQTADAIAGLEAVIAAIKKTPDKKSVKVDALSKSAIDELEALGFKVKRLPDGRFEVIANTATAQGRLGDVQAARDRLKGKEISIDADPSGFWASVTGLVGRVLGTSYINVAYRKTDSSLQPKFQADGGLLDFYAQGGIRSADVRSFANGAERHVAQIAPAGSWRVWAEPETGGEAYVPLAPSKRGRSRQIVEETVRRLGGDPAMIQWNADGSVTDWRYDPQTGSLYSPSDAGQAGKKTKKVKGKDVDYFDLGAVEKKLKSAAKATQAWNKDLEKVAERVGGDVAEALASMGEEGMKLADKMANGSTKYINEMADALRKLQETAKATLTDYTRQLTGANKINQKFANDLAKLSAMGYDDLAAQLAAQNDEAAQQLAAAAIKDPSKAAKADAAAKTANNALTADQVQALVQIIAAISSNKVGIHDVAAKTGLGEDEIITVANKAHGQIRGSLGSKATKFLSDLRNANAGKAYANGGIRAGIYASQAGIIRFAEPETGGEAYLPLSPSKRRTAMPVLADVARRFGVGLTDAQASRPVVIVQGGGDTHVNVTAVRSGATASDIAAQVGRSVRRARRGGVAARAA
jgi:Ca2+-binding EF-hand superfamily protein